MLQFKHLALSEFRSLTFSYILHNLLFYVRKSVNTTLYTITQVINFFFIFIQLHFSAWSAILVMVLLISVLPVYTSWALLASPFTAVSFFPILFFFFRFFSLLSTHVLLICTFERNDLVSAVVQTRWAVLSKWFSLDSITVVSYSYILFT